MLNNILNPSILENFSQIISDHDDFLIKKYSNFEGKKKISVIFSARDWLHTIVHGLPNIDLSHPNQDTQSLNVFQFVSTIDLLTEAIQQLYRVLYNKRHYPLSQDKTVFNKNISDDQYFAHIRAVFGAHPVNLKSYDGNPNGNTQYFASWSSSHGTGDFSVYLYSNDPKESDKEFPISFDSLIKYAQKRYDYLKEISKEIQRQQIEFNNLWIKTPIEKKKEPLEQLHILKTENDNRFGNSGYKYQIGTLIDLFSAPRNFPKDFEIYDRFLNSLKQSINDIYYNLQNMQILDLSIYPVPEYLGIKSLRNFFYDIKKLNEYLIKEADMNNNLDYVEINIADPINRLISVNILPDYTVKELDRRDLLLILYTWLVENGANIIRETFSEQEAFPADIEINIIDDIDAE
ncbi:hypothetical protein COK55_24555 [Bacillus cereus]|nr:hypothetical protein COK55_24555 [Bacillus cereus]